MRASPRRQHAGSRPRAADGARPAGSATAARRPSRRAAGRRGPSAAVRRATIRPPSSTTIRLHSPSSRSVLCSATSSAVPRRGEPAERLADEARALRIELRGRLVEDEVGRPHRKERGDHHELRLAARQPSRLALGEVPRCRASPARAFVRSTVSRAGSPRFIGPSATSSNTEPVTPDSWVAGFWKPIPTRVENSWRGLPAMSAPSIVRLPVSAAADRARGEPRRDQAERRLARLVGADDPDDLAGRRASGRCRGGRASRSRRSGSRRRASCSIAGSDPAR